jgi:hypothetical protein
MYGEKFRDYPKRELERMKRSLDQLHCWQRLLGSPVSLGQAITSPFRPDNKPGCFLQQLPNGDILFKDFGAYIGHNYNVINAYSHVYQCTTGEAITNLYFERFDKIVPVKIGEIVAAPCANDDTVITVQPFMQGAVPVFTQNHLDFWKVRGITLPDLQSCSNHKVLAVHSFKVNDLWSIANRTTFAYQFDNGRVKLYQPGASRKIIASTATTDDIWKWNRESDTVIVDKSFKDGVLTAKMFPQADVWAIQGESMISEELKTLSKYSKILVKGDNDQAGETAVSKILTMIDSPIAIPFFFPKEVKGSKIKDTDDMVMSGNGEYAKKLMACYLD